MACKNCKDVVVESCDTCYCNDTVCTPCKIQLADKCIKATSDLPNIGANLNCQDLNTVLLAINNKLSNVASGQYYATNSATNNFRVVGADEYRWAGELATGINLWNHNVYTEGLDAAPGSFGDIGEQRSAGIPVPNDIAAGAKLVLTGTFTNLNNNEIDVKVYVGLTPCNDFDLMTQIGVATIETAQEGTIHSACFRQEFTVPTGGIDKGTDLIHVGWQMSKALVADDDILVTWTLSA